MQLTCLAGDHAPAQRVAVGRCDVNRSAVAQAIRADVAILRWIGECRSGEKQKEPVQQRTGKRLHVQSSSKAEGVWRNAGERKACKFRMRVEPTSSGHGCRHARTNRYPVPPAR